MNKLHFCSGILNTIHWEQSILNKRCIMHWSVDIHPRILSPNKEGLAS